MTSVETFLQSRQDEMLEVLRSLVKIPSAYQKPEPDMPFGPDCAKALHTMLDVCEKNGLSVQNFNNCIGTASWGDNPRVGILCHLDVVPADNDWDTDPFDCTIQDGKIFGRGTIDDKGPAVSALYGLLAVIHSGAKPKGGVQLIFGTDEECGSRDLEPYLKEHTVPPIIFTPDANYPLINIEKGILRILFSKKVDSCSHILSFHGGDTINAIPACASALVVGITEKELQKIPAPVGCSLEVQKQENGLLLTMHGKTAHASLPENGQNPITALLDVLAKSSLPGEDMEAIRLASALFAHGEHGGKQIDIACEEKRSGRLTAALTVFDKTPEGFLGGIDIRFPLGRTAFDLFHRARIRFEADGWEARMGDYYTETHEAPEDSELVQKLLQAYEETTGHKGKCLSSGGGTYAHEFENAVAFGPAFLDTDYHLHSANEFIPIDEFFQNARIIARAIELLATQ